MLTHRILPVCALLILVAAGCSAETVWLSSLQLDLATEGWGEPQADKSVEGHQLSLGGQKFDKGFGTHSVSELRIDLNGGTEKFTAVVGVDDEVGQQGSVEFTVVADGRTVFDSGLMKGGDPPKPVEVDCRGVKTLILKVGDGGDGINWDHADWADAKFEVTGEKPKSHVPGGEEFIILTPAASPKPQINGARVFGVRPGNPFQFKVAATGQKPLAYTASGMPEGLSLDPVTGLLTGKAPAAAGTYRVKLTVSNALGSATRELRIEVGERICLTPPMGWNSWNCWAGAVDADKVRRAAKAMAASGLMDHGWTYVNIDDCWQAKRGGPFNGLQGNEKFPDMKALCDEIHALGLKPGIYSTPWMTSYGGYPGGSSNTPDGAWNHEGGHGKVGFEDSDAKQYAAWGFDYLKYDWNPNDIPHVAKMSAALRACGRDIVFSLSNGAPYEQASDWARLSNCWRTTGDINDHWGSMSGIGFSQDAWAPFAGPGHWNDPDMLVVGQVGWGPVLHRTHLTPNEQYTHISLWCLLSAPLLLGCDLERLDPFTLGLLTNDEVLAVSQDSLGKQARRVAVVGKAEVWCKELEDGTRAVGLFNRGEDEAQVTVTWPDCWVQGKQAVRDLWRQKDMGTFEGQFTATVGRHGVVLVKLTRAAGMMGG